MNTFDLVLLLIISEATQQALLGDDFSLTTAALVITTLITVDRLTDYLGFRFPAFSRVTDSVPLVVVDDGRLLEDRLKRLHIDEADILAAARQNQGLERMDQIKYAVLEKEGSISIVPRR
nr:YetF domain-containing protein [Streptomyces taklimakanensis]